MNWRTICQIVLGRLYPKKGISCCLVCLVVPPPFCFEQCVPKFMIPPKLLPTSLHQPHKHQPPVTTHFFSIHATASQSTMSSSKQPPTKKHKPTPNANPNTAGNSITRGASEVQLASRRRAAKSHLTSLSPSQQSSVLARYHGTSRTDLFSNRLRNLKRDDANQDTSNLSDLQIRNSEKRRHQKNVGLRRQTARRETKRLENAIDALHAEEILHSHNAGVIEVENDMERTAQLTQERLKKEMLDENVGRNIYDLELNDYSPYKLSYDRSGRYSLLCGRKGHVAVIDQHTMGLSTEFHLGETARDAIFLHNGTMMAVAQERNVYVYDENGAEVHRLDSAKRVWGMEFLPYHWLLGEESLCLWVCVCAFYEYAFLTSFLFDVHFKSHNRPRWLPSIPRHLDRRNRLSTSHQTRSVRHHSSKPLQCRPPFGSLQRHRHAMVPFQQRIPCQNALSQRICSNFPGH